MKTCVPLSCVCVGGLYIPLGVPVACYPDAPFPGWAPAAWGSSGEGPLVPLPPPADPAPRR